MRRSFFVTAVSVIFVLLLVSVGIAAAPDRDRTYVVTPETARAMEEAAPAAPLVKPARPRKVLVYGRVPTHPESVACCFKAMEIMGHRGGAWWVKPDEPEHPLCAPLGGQSFEVRDEIYVFRKPLSREPMTRQSVRALLSLDLGKMEDPKLREDGDYAISWIRTFGKGRVFYCTLGHAKTAYTNPAVMKHYLAGIQFAAGDLPADAAPRP